MTNEINWTPEQIKALEELKAWAKSPLTKMMAFSGVAGSGKTTTLSELKKHLPGNVEWTAMTGKAALRLSQAAGVEAKTLHAALYKPPHNSGRTVYFSQVKKPQCGVLVIDEASMVTPKIFNDLSLWEEQGVKILFVGDGVQLPPILSQKEEQEYGDDFIIFKKVKGPNLTKVMRSGDGIIDIASSVRELKRFPTVGNSAVKISEVTHPGVEAIKDYLDDSEDHFLITWTNKMRMQGNLWIRKKRGYTQALPEPSEPILICKNGQGKLNGEIVYANSFERGPTIAEMSTHWMNLSDGTQMLVSCAGKDQFFDGSLPNIKDWKAYHMKRRELKLEEPTPVTYGYVLTGHKMQGSEARRVTVYLSGNDLASPHFNKQTTLPNGEMMPFSMRWCYTSFSRAKERLGFYYSS